MMNQDELESLITQLENAIELRTKLEYAKVNIELCIMTADAMEHTVSSRYIVDKLTETLKMWEGK